MLSEENVEELLERNSLPELGRARVRWIRANAPVRRTEGGRKASKVRYISKKMPFVLEAEAFNTEFAALATYDRDEETLEIYNQPTHLKLRYVNRNGRKVAPDITPDLFLIRQGECVFVECKTEDELHKLAAKEPNRYQLDGDGRWRSYPAEDAARQLGCEFWIRSTRDNNWNLIENMEFLDDFFPDVCKPPEAPTADVIQAFFKAKPWATVTELVKGELQADADTLYSLIAAGGLYFDLFTDRLADYDHAIVYRDEDAATAYRLFALSETGLISGQEAPLPIEVGARFVWDGTPWEIINVGNSNVAARALTADGEAKIIDISPTQLSALAGAGKLTVPKDDKERTRQESEAQDLLRLCSPEQFQTGVYRYEVLFGNPAPENPMASRKLRAQQYWHAKWREAEVRYGYGFLGLIPNLEHTQGNHTSKLDPAVLEAAKSIIAVEWSKPKQLGITPIFGKINLACQEIGREGISVKTVRKLIKEQATHKQLAKRKGDRAAYSDEPEFLILEYTTPRHGVRPFQIGHIDHTPVDLIFLDKSLTCILKSLWLSVMLDANSRRILAIYLSYDPPSDRTNMMVLRDCVRRHGRLPKWLVVDGGPDFRSVYFEKTLAAYRVNKRERPKSKPRFGSLIERVFRTTTEAFVHLLWGNTQAHKNFRQVSPEVDPVRHATWTLERFAALFEEYVEKVYHENIHETLGCSPNTAYLDGMRLGGQRHSQLIPYNKGFLIETCPSTKKGTARITQHGVKINYLNYRGPVLNLPGLRGKDVPVRYEPFNKGIAYAFVNDAWQELHSEYFATFSRFTERAIQLASRHYHLLNKQGSKASRLNAERLAMFLRSVEDEEWLLQQMRRDAENAPHRESVGVAAPASASMPQPKPPILTRPSLPPNLLEDF